MASGADPNGPRIVGYMASGADPNGQRIVGYMARIVKYIVSIFWSTSKSAREGWHGFHFWSTSKSAWERSQTLLPFLVHYGFHFGPLWFPFWSTIDFKSYQYIVRVYGAYHIVYFSVQDVCSECFESLRIIAYIILDQKFWATLKPWDLVRSS